MIHMIHGKECGVVEGVKCGAPRWPGNTKRIWENELVKRVYKARNEGGGVRGRPHIKSTSRVSKYWSERVEAAGWM